MALIALDNATLRLGTQALLDGANAQIHAGDRIGLMGPNGAGKTSLLRLINGDIELDHGQVHRQKEVRVGYLPQHLASDTDGTLLELIRAAAPVRTELEAEIAALEDSMVSLTPEEATEAASHLAALHERLSHYDSEYGDHVGLAILAGLGFAPRDAQRSLSEFSGGWQMRAILAGLLFSKPDVLLMDEPTNHLDLTSVEWFASYLKQYRGAFVLISHDRDFLNEQITHVVSFEPEGLRTYKGNVDDYVRQRTEEATVLANQQRNLAREKEKAELFIRRFRAKASKASAVQSRVKALEKMGEVQTLTEHAHVRFAFPPAPPSGKVALEAEGITKRYGSHTVLEGVGLGVRRGEKVGVIGNNGAGKTTLLRMLAGELPRDGGTVRLGHNVVMAYYAQHHTEILQPEATVLAEVMRGNQDYPEPKVRSMLGGMLFRGEDLDKPIRVLSGGERARVALARLLLSGANLFLMDEPTNHLDLWAAEELADALAEYDGTLIFVSHNRGFLRRLASTIWHVHDRAVEPYPGTLDEYLARSARPNSTPAAPKLTPKPAPKKDDRRDRARAQDARRKQLRPLEQRVSELERQIAALEEAQRGRSAQLADPDVYQSPQGQDIVRDYQRDTAELEALNAAWEQAAMALEEARVEHAEP